MNPRKFALGCIMKDYSSRVFTTEYAEFAEIGVFLEQKLFSPRPQRLRGETS